MNSNTPTNKEDGSRIVVQVLSERHRQMLFNESGISKAVVAARGYRTITDAKELQQLGFAKSQRRVPGLLIPVHSTDGSIGLYQFRPDEPRFNTVGKPVKYETQAKAGMRLDCPPACRPQLANPFIPLWITEGVKKADKMATEGLCAVALLGVWNFKGRNSFDGVSILADFDYIAWNERDVRVVFDSDIVHKPSVRKAMERLREHLGRKGARISIVYLPDENDGKTGVDDFLRGHSPEELEKLTTQPKPRPQPADPVYEVLDEPPASMSRLLQIIKGQAYAMTRLYVKLTVKESLDENHNLVQHNPPVETIRLELRVIRDDGVMFGYGTENPLEKLEFQITYPDYVAPNRLLPPQMISNLERGIRPDPVEVFKQIVQVVDRFFDFSRSLADQKTMCELIATYIFATWFIEAFNVAGYLWITGGRGSGKTQLLITISELAYLGQVILASSSLATLRDLADVGAFLGFDDAENLSSARQSDPDKRALLLAGNRRGSTVTLKEPLPGERGWKIRNVSTFCHRSFTATSRPEAILSSRAIVVPLTRTNNRAKANTDPLDERRWSCPPQQIRGELWLISLFNLVKMQHFEEQVVDRAALTGRNLEAWRGVLTIALWLDSLDMQGALRRKGDGMTAGAPEGLFERLDRLSLNYQKVRGDFEMNDYTRLVLRAVVNCIMPGNQEMLDEIVEVEKLRSLAPEFYLTTQNITEQARRMVEVEELDFDLEWINSRRVGRVVKQLRFTSKRASGDGKAGWIIKRQDLEDLLDSYGMLGVRETLLDTPAPTSQTSLTSRGCGVECEFSEVSEVKDGTERNISATADGNGDF